MPANLAIRSRADAPHLKKAALAIEQAAWSNLGYLSYTRSHYEYYAELLDAYPEFQLCLVDEETDYPVAVASSVPFVCSGPDDLPPEGWDWVVETAARNKDHETNMLGGLAVSVPAVHRSKGYARVMIRSLLQLAEGKGLDGVVVPVRPSAKAMHPWVPIADYMAWTDDSGRPYDPWLRSHCLRRRQADWALRTLDGRAGTHRVLGELVEGSASRDRALTRLKVRWRRSGSISIARRGTYEEPNVWVAYTA